MLVKVTPTLRKYTGRLWITKKENQERKKGLIYNLVLYPFHCIYLEHIYYFLMYITLLVTLC